MFAPLQFTPRRMLKPVQLLTLVASLVFVLLLDRKSVV